MADGKERDARPMMQSFIAEAPNAREKRGDRWHVEHVETSQRLVIQAQAGDAGAFGELIALHERAALALAYATVGNASAAGDVVQDAFLRAWQKIAELKDPQRFGAWLGRIVRNMATDVIRRGPRPAEPLDERVTMAATASRESDPQDRWSRNELRQAIDGALNTLDELTRSAVVLRYFEEMSSKQIGELLDLSPAAVDMRLSRARSQLREKLAPQGWLGVEPANSIGSDSANA